MLSFTERISNCQSLDEVKSMSISSLEITLYQSTKHILLPVLEATYNKSLSLLSPALRGRATSYVVEYKSESIYGEFTNIISSISNSFCGSDKKISFITLIKSASEMSKHLVKNRSVYDCEMDVDISYIISELNKSTSITEIYDTFTSFCKIALFNTITNTVLPDIEAIYEQSMKFVDVDTVISVAEANSNRDDKVYSISSELNSMIFELEYGLWFDSQYDYMTSLYIVRKVARVLSDICIDKKKQLLSKMEIPQIHQDDVAEVPELVANMISKATKIETPSPEPISNRFRLKTYIWCVDELPKQYVVEEINRLYFVNDRHGFFIANKNNIVNLASNIEDWDTGIDTYLEVDKVNMGSVGSRLLLNVNGDIIVYKITGFVNDKILEHYLDIK